MDTSKTKDSIETFSAFAGEAAELVSFNRSVGQLYGALFISGKALSLKELASLCKMSKGNASIHLRILQEWGAVEPANRPGTREDFYIANTNLSELVLQRLRQGMKKRLQFARTKLEQVKTQLGPGSGDAEAAARWEKLEKLEDLLNRAESFFAMFQKFSKLQDMFSFGGLKEGKDGGR